MVKIEIALEGTVSASFKSEADLERFASHPEVKQMAEEGDDARTIVARYIASEIEYAITSRVSDEISDDTDTDLTPVPRPARVDRLRARGRGVRANTLAPRLASWRAEVAPSPA